MMGTIHKALTAWIGFGCLWLGVPAAADDRAAHLPADLEGQVRKSIDRALSFLRSAQKDDGGWADQHAPAINAIVARAFALDRGHGPNHPIVRRALASILRQEQSDGGIYDRGQNLANYETSVVLMFLSSLDDPTLRPRIAKAQAYLTSLQFDQGESIDPRNNWYGGAGYNQAKRPDLSNTQMMIDALHQSGLSKSDPVYQRAMVFVSRCQMNSATNDQDFARESSDGGFIYSPNENGESKASIEVPEGKAALRSYGSMTYAGFKSMLYANLKRDDPRVKACHGWIKRHYTLDKNPGMPGARAREGLYYYYHVFAAALEAWGEPVVVDDRGQSHHWRIDLCRKLLSLQKPDGSWINDQTRWLEGQPIYVTGLMVQTLQVAAGE